MFTKINTITPLCGLLGISGSMLVGISTCHGDDFQKQYPVYRKSDIEYHKNPTTGYWVTYKDGVYDITSFIPNHPGGEDKIKLAAGKAVEPFWRIYQGHYDSKLPMEMLSNLKIGTLHPDDVKSNENMRDSSDPYRDDPEISPVLYLHSLKPINGEPPCNLLGESFITPNSLWFIRNHHPVPKIDIAKYKLTISVESNTNQDIEKVHEPVTLSFEDLKSKFKQYDVTTSIQCGGNRRDGMSAIVETAGKPWSVAAIATAKWTGVRLCDVIEASCGLTYSKLLDLWIQEDNGAANREELAKLPRHVHFIAADGVNVSIPIAKAMNYFGDVLLAYEMNGAPIPPEHGYPVRVVVPGHVGIRNLKWVEKVIISDEEAVGAWQSGMAYKGFGPNVKSVKGIDTASIQSLQEQPIQSAVTYPVQSSVVERGPTTVKGYAYSGGGKKIIRVDVSADGGNTWHQATLLDGDEQVLGRAWAWTLWECDIDLSESSHQLVCKATDNSYSNQPDTVKGIWNLRGINNNAWHRVDITTTKFVEEDEE